jgi:RHS repeat-associated protein
VTAYGDAGPRFLYGDDGRLRILRRTESEIQSTSAYDGRGFLWRTLSREPDGAGGSYQRILRARYSSEGVLRWTEKEPGDGSPTVERQVLYFAGRPVAIVERLGNSPIPSVLYLTTDHLGTPALASDGSGNEVWSGGFEPFGEDWNGAQSAGVFLRFPGQWDDESWATSSLGGGVSYNVYRWYGYTNSRYVRPDPLGVQGDNFSLYNYVESNPLGGIDPNGLITLRPGDKCRAFDNAVSKIKNSKTRCRCKNFFSGTFGADLEDLLDGPKPVLEITPKVPFGTVAVAGRTPCEKKPGVIEITKSLCGFGMANDLAHRIVHELGHFADCNQQKFPPGGSIEEGCLAEIWCLGSTGDARASCKALERAITGILDR